MLHIFVLNQLLRYKPRHLLPLIFGKFAVEGRVSLEPALLNTLSRGVAIVNGLQSPFKVNFSNLLQYHKNVGHQAQFVAF